MTYLLQRDSNSCAPLALMNARRYLLHPVRYKDLEYHRLLCHTDTDGTDWGYYVRAVRQTIGVYTTIYERSAPHIDYIIKLLTCGYCVIVSLEAECESHVVFIERVDDEGKMYVANWQQQDGKGFFNERTSQHAWISTSRVEPLITTDTRMVYFSSWRIK